MSEAEVVDIGVQTIIVATKLAGPILLVSLVVGTLISLIQAVTQVQEMTLTFVPKLAGVAAVLVIAGGWMLNELAAFARGLLAMVPDLIA